MVDDIRPAKQDDPSNVDNADDIDFASIDDSVAQASINPEDDESLSEDISMGSDDDNPKVEEASDDAKENAEGGSEIQAEIDAEVEEAEDHLVEEKEDEEPVEKVMNSSLESKPDDEKVIETDEEPAEKPVAGESVDPEVEHQDQHEEEHSDEQDQEEDEPKEELTNLGSDVNHMPKERTIHPSNPDDGERISVTNGNSMPAEDNQEVDQQTDEDKVTVAQAAANVDPKVALEVQEVLGQTDDAPAAPAPAPEPEQEPEPQPEPEAPVDEPTEEPAPEPEEEPKEMESKEPVETPEPVEEHKSMDDPLDGLEDPMHRPEEEMPEEHMDQPAPMQAPNQGKVGNDNTKLIVAIAATVLVAMTLIGIGFLAYQSNVEANNSNSSTRA